MRAHPIHPFSPAPRHCRADCGAAARVATRLSVLCAFAVLWAGGVPQASATAYVWSAPSGGGSAPWSSVANWTPGGGPPAAPGDTARFDATSTRTCAVGAATVFVAAVDLAAGFNGSVTAVGSGSLRATTVTVQSGTLSALSGKAVAASSFEHTGGTVTDLACEGDATVTGSATLLSLRLRGPDGALTVPLLGQVFGVLEVQSGRTTLTGVAVPGTTRIDAGTTLALGQRALLTATLHDIQGGVELSSGSALVFTLGATLPASTRVVMGGASAITCFGNWSCAGSFEASPLSALYIDQSGSGDTIDHGGQEAGAAVVRNAAGRTTTWNGTARLTQLTVATSATKLAVTGTLATTATVVNLGTIEELSGGYIKHPAEGLWAAAHTGLAPVSIVAAGQPFRMVLTDSDESLRFDAIDTAAGLTATVVSPPSARVGDTVTVPGTETSANATTFATAAIPTAVSATATPDDGVLQVQPGDVIELAYADDDDPADTATATITVGAAVPVTVSAVSVE